MPRGGGARQRQRERRRQEIGEERWRAYQIHGMIRRHQLDRGAAVLVYSTDGRLLGQVTPERAAEVAVDGLGRIADGALVLRPGAEAWVRTEPVSEGAAAAHIGRSMVREHTPGATWATGAAARTARAVAYETEADRRVLKALQQGGGRQVVAGMVLRTVREAGREAAPPSVAPEPKPTRLRSPAWEVRGVLADPVLRQLVAAVQPDVARFGDLLAAARSGDLLAALEVLRVRIRQAAEEDSSGDPDLRSRLRQAQVVVARAKQAVRLARRQHGQENGQAA